MKTKNKNCLIFVLATVFVVFIFFFTALAAPPPTQNVHMIEGNSYLSQKKYADAITKFATVIAKDPKATEAYRLRGIAYRNINQNENSLADFNKAIELAPNNFRCYIDRAMTKKESGDFQGAVSDMNTALSLAPTNDLPRLSGQLADYRITYHADGYLSRLHTQLGNYKYEAGDYNGAIETCTKAKKVGGYNQNYPEISICVGQSYIKLRQFDNAIKELDAALSAGNAVWRYRAKAYLEMGKLTSARLDFDKAFDSNPGLATMPDVRSDLDKLQVLQKAGLVKEVPPLDPNLVFQPVTAPEPLPDSGNENIKQQKTENTLTPASTVTSGQPKKAKARKGRQSDPMASLPASDLIWQDPTQQKPVIPATGVPLELSQPLDIKKLTLDQYRRVVGAAREAVRLLEGEMSPEETKIFNQKWGAVVYYPTPEAIAYLNSLNPLLVEFLSLRSLIYSASEEFDAAWMEGTIAAGYGNASGAKEAYAVAGDQKTVFESLNARLAQVMTRIEALGNPPNVATAMSSAAAHHGEYVDVVKKLAGETKAPDTQAKKTGQALTGQPTATKLTPTKGAWFLRRVEKINMVQVPPEGADFKRTSTESSLTLQNLRSYTIGNTGTVSVSWAAPPQKIEEGSIQIKYTLQREGGPKYCNTSLFADMSDMLTAVTAYEGFLYDSYKKAGPEAFKTSIVSRKLATLEGNPGSGGNCSGGSIEKTLEKKLPAPYPGRLFEVLVGGQIINEPPAGENCCKGYDSWIVRNYVYEYFADAELVPAKDETEESGDQEAVAFHEANIAILEKNLAREEADFGRETDKDRKEAFDFRIKTIKADIQAEKDLIESIQTGEIVHTRTEFDDYLRDQFIANIQANQMKMEMAQRQAAAAQRIAAMLPPGEDDAARKFIERQLTPEVLAKADFDKIQQVTNALSGKLSGYLQQAEAQKEIGSAERSLMMLNGLQTAGNIAITFVGGRPGATLYAGFTGYITGGPSEALRGAASWYSTGGYMAVEAYDGYTKGGFLAGKGVAGAAEKAAEALLIGKLFDYGLKKIGAATGPLTQPANREQLKQRLDSFKRNEMLRERLKDFHQAESMRAGLPDFQVTRFKMDMTRGKSLVDEFAQIGQRLQIAKQTGAAKETVQKLESLSAQKAKEINASFHAKNYLKATGGEVEKMAYDRIEQIYKKVDEVFRRKMAAQKWDMRYLKFREFRNASSRGKIGMDRDFGLVEDEVTLLIKNGKPSSINQIQKDGQKAYKEAYEEVMEQSYEKSFQEFTTRAHSESFLDINVLSDLRKPENVAKLQRIWGEQTARTIEYKGLHMLRDSKLDPHLLLLDRHLEASRGLAKELDKKVIPFLQNAKASAGIDLKKVQETEKHFRELKKILDDFSSYKIDPLTASEKIRLHTGGKDLPQVLDQVRNVTEALFKFGALGK